MSTIVKTRIVKIGNSQGVRIPKPILQQVDLWNEVEMEVQGEQLILRPARKNRSGWEAQFEQMAAHGDDGLLDDFLPLEDEEWEWSPNDSMSS